MYFIISKKAKMKISFIIEVETEKFKVRVSVDSYEEALLVLGELNDFFNESGDVEDKS